MKSLAYWTLLVVCVGSLPWVSNCGGESNSGTLPWSGSSGTGGSGAIVGETPCLRACSNFARFCGDPTCTAVCAGVEAAYDAPLCSSEAKAQFDCVAGLQASDFDCGTDAGDTLNQAVEALMSRGATDKCNEPYTAYAQCRRTNGADCAPEPAFDESCAVTDSAHPHFRFCKVDVPAPANCVSYLTASDGWYCCE